MGELSYQFLGSFIAMAVPLLFLALILDDPGSRRIVLYFCWGAFAGVLAYNLNNFFGSTFEQAQRIHLSIAPPVEEICKILPVLLFLNRKKYPRVTKLVVFCAMAVGVGFSIQESMYYFAASSREIGDLTALVIRTMTTALMHGMTAAAFGIGLLLLHNRRHLLFPLIFGLLALSVSIHALFNLLLQTHFAAIALVMPITMFAAGWMFIRNVEKP